jgi:hypothetical protein
MFHRMTTTTQERRVHEICQIKHYRSLISSTCSSVRVWMKRIEFISSECGIIIRVLRTEHFPNQASSQDDGKKEHSTEHDYTTRHRKSKIKFSTLVTWRRWSSLVFIYDFFGTWHKFFWYNLQCSPSEDIFVHHWIKKINVMYYPIQLWGQTTVTVITIYRTEHSIRRDDISIVFMIKNKLTFSQQPTVRTHRKRL